MSTEVCISGKSPVTFPSRQYVVNGERRSFALLRPVVDAAAEEERMRKVFLEAYVAYESGLADSEPG